MVKRKIEKIEEAEIIVSKDSKNNDSLVMEKVNKLRTQFKIFLVFSFIALITIFGILVYSEYNGTKEMITLQGELKPLTATETVELIDNELNYRELAAQKKTIELIEEAVENLEVNIVDKLNSVADIGDNREVIKILQDELLELQLQFDMKISEMSKTNNEKRESFLSEGRGSVELQTMLDSLDLKAQRKFEVLTNNLTHVEKEFLLLKNKVLDIELSITEKRTNNISANKELYRELDESFVKIAYSALKIEAQRNIRGNPWSKLISTLKSLFVFRSTEPKEGNTLDAILSRAEYMLSTRNFEGCLNELNSLDEVSLELFSKWIEKISLLKNTTS